MSARIDLNVFTFAARSSEPPDDVKTLASLINDPPRTLQKFFRDDETLHVARAPGRLDVMGGIADYSGSLVMPMPIAESTIVAVQTDPERTIRILSFEPGSELTFEMPLSDLDSNADPLEYSDLRERFQKSETDSWAAYVVGVLFVLHREKAIEFQNGVRILITSTIPVGKGVSSSAALEVAVMQAVCSAFRIEISSLEKALLCQKAENLVVGSPCGVMDQIASTCGEENKLLRIFCQPAEILGSTAIPASIGFWGIDSGVRHSVSGSDYGAVRVGAFMGYRIIADLAGLAPEPAGHGLVKIKDDQWSGYLCNITVAEYEEQFLPYIPKQMTGYDFLIKYTGTTDPVTNISPDTTYAVKVPTEHAIYENDRVNRFSRLMRGPCGESELKELGRLMYQSHEGYAACGLTEERTERLVELARENHENRIYGARITGGGSGGTVLFMGSSESGETVRKLARKFGEETGSTAYVFDGSSSGCALSGNWELLPASRGD
ncbi:MAG: galactokinase family protein [Acidobacteriota bacterium]